MLDGEAHLQAYETVRADGGMTASVYGRWPVAQWKWLAERVRTRGMGDDLFTLRSLKGLRRRLDRLVHRPLLRAVHGRPARTYGLPSDVWSRAARTGAWPPTPPGLQISVHAIGDRAIHETLDDLRPRRSARTDCATAARASSTTSTRTRATSRATWSWA